MTAEEFEFAYAERCQKSVQELRRFRTVRPCDCGEDMCMGWQSISFERAKEYDLARILDAIGLPGETDVGAIKELVEALQEVAALPFMSGEPDANAAITRARGVLLRMTKSVAEERKAADGNT